LIISSSCYDFAGNCVLLLTANLPGLTPRPLSVPTERGDFEIYLKLVIKIEY